MSPRLVPMVVALALVAGCTPAGARLDVQLVTDYAPIRDFDTVTVALDDGATVAMFAAPDRSYGRPTRVAQLESVSPGRHRLTVVLQLRGTHVQEQPHVVEVVGSVTAVTIRMTRDCAGISCPGADAPSAIACLGGVCVDPGCDEAHPTLCPSTCAEMCGSSTIPCVTRGCGAEGVCLDTPNDTLCPTGQICVADLGCRPPFTTPDDTGVTSDAGLDATADAGLPPTLDEFGTLLAQHACAGIAQCVGPLYDDVSATDCAHRFASAYLATTAPRMREAEAAGTFTYDASFATACLAALDISLCENVVSGLPTVCENALQGRVAPGGACNDTFECMGDAFCDPDAISGCPLGVCTARRASGGACGAVGGYKGDEQCQRGLRCVAGVCASPVGIGGACSDGSECEAGAFCVGRVPSRHCATFAEAFGGATAAGCDAVQGPWCARPLSCSAGGAVCIAAVTADAACVGAIPDACPDGQYCDTSAGVAQCRPLPTDGQPCLSAFALACAGGLECGADAICHDVRSVGAACTTPAECASHLCTAMVCTAPPLCAP